MLTQVLLVETQRGLIVQFVENVAFGPGNQPLGTEWVPSPERPRADAQAVTVESNGGDVVCHGLAVPEHESAGKPVTISRQTTCDGDVLGKPRGQPGHEIGTIDAQSIAKHEDVNEIRRQQRLG